LATYALWSGVKLQQLSAHLLGEFDVAVMMNHILSTIETTMPERAKGIVYQDIDSAGASHRSF